MSNPRNPWLPAASEPESSVVILQPKVPITGADTPQRSVPVPDLDGRLPMVETRETASIWCVGVHGGSGESRIASLDEKWRESGHAWPLPDESTAKVLLVARSNMTGLLAAQSAAKQWAAGIVPNVQVIGLAIVPDAPGRMPKPLRDMAKIVGGGVPRVWHLPWVEEWRIEDSATTTVPRNVAKFMSDLHTLSIENNTVRKEQS